MRLRIDHADLQSTRTQETEHEAEAQSEARISRSSEYSLSDAGGAPCQSVEIGIVCDSQCDIQGAHDSSARYIYCGENTFHW